jgi:copper chaperone CopZ
MGRPRGPPQGLPTVSVGKQVSCMRLSLPIYGLGCGGGGALTVERALARVPGVAQAYVNPATEQAYIEAGPALADRQRLIAAVESVGFRAGEVVER